MQDDELPEELSEEEWLERRKQGIGGTDIAAIVGVNPWRSPLDVYCEKLGLTAPREPSDQMEYGNIMEAFALKLYTKYSGNRVIHLGRRLFRHPFIPWWQGTPDAIVPAKGPGVEAKTANSYMRSEWGPEGSDEVPKWYRVQVEWYMPLVRRDVFDFAAWFAGTKFEMFRVHGEPALREQLQEAGERFMRDHIQAQTPPPMDASLAAEQYLKVMYPKELADVRVATAAEEVALALLWEARANRKAAEETETAMENTLKEIIGESAGVESQGFRALWKMTKDARSINWQAVADELGAADQPEIVRRHTSMRPGVRRFTLNKREGR